MGLVKHCKNSGKYPPSFERRFTDSYREVVSIFESVGAPCAHDLRQVEGSSKVRAFFAVQGEDKNKRDTLWMCVFPVTSIWSILISFLEAVFARTPD